MFVKGNKVFIHNKRTGKDTMVGLIVEKGTQYLSFRREILDKWESLGISKDVLVYLKNRNIDHIIFNIIEKNRAWVMTSTVTQYLNSRLILYSKDEDVPTHHVRISDLNHG